jgi:hypothetical protein
MIENWRGNAPVTTIIDFGLAKSFRNGVGANRHLTAKGFLTGNAIYQSPVTFNDYRHHTPLDDYYSVLHIFYLLVYKNLFYEQLCDKPYEQVIEIVKTCKEEGSDPFLEEEKFGECTPEDEEDGTRECVQCLREFHRIVREAYSDIYDTNTWQPKDEECVKEQLSAAEAKIVEVFG